MKSQSPGKQRPPLDWERALTWLLYATTGWVTFLALSIAVASKDLVPGYDGLGYLNTALRMNIAFTSGQLTQMFKYLPFTNTLDVVLLAFVYQLVDFHIGIWLIHTAYVVVFLYLLRRVLDVSTTALVFLWAVSHAFFLHQYTEFISEMKVGMFLTLFTVYLFHENDEERSKPLFWITVLLLLLRTITILFVLPLGAAFAVLRRREGAAWKEVMADLAPVGLALLFLAPLMLGQIRPLVSYMYGASLGDTAQNWRDMAGVTGKWSLLLSYVDILMLYQRELAICALGVIALGLGLHLTGAVTRLAAFRTYAVATLVVFGVLMLAQTNNVMISYWPYLLIGLTATAVVVSLVKPIQSGLIAALLIPVALYVNYSSFVNVSRSIPQQGPTMTLANELAGTTRAFEKPIIFQNFWGIGSLDVYGLEIITHKNMISAPVNSTSYNTSLAEYLAALKSANVVFIANRNFMWPPYVGVNHKTEAIAREVSSRAEEMGLIKATRLYADSNQANYIDVYLRPAVSVKLKYVDRWLDQETPLVLSSATPKQPLNGFVMEMNLSVPGVEYQAFALPLTATLIDSNGEVTRTAVIGRDGPNKIAYPLDGLLPGNYRIVFDKTFSAKNDPRNLAALFVDATIKHVRNAADSAGGAK